MLSFCIVLSALLCAALTVCSYLYAERKHLRALVARQDAVTAKQETQIADWITKALARNSMTPLGEEREETRSPDYHSQSLDLRPPIASKQAEWDEEERREAEREYPLPLPHEVQTELLAAAREVTA